MKRILWLVVVSLLLIPQAGALGNSQTPDILSGFPNGGFETNPTDPSNGWTWPNNNWVWDGSIAHEGTHSARVYRDSGDQTASLWSTYVPVQPSKVYTLSFWLRTENVNKEPTVSIYQYTNGNAQTGPG